MRSFTAPSQSSAFDDPLPLTDRVCSGAEMVLRRPLASPGRSTNQPALELEVHWVLCDTARVRGCGCPGNPLGTRECRSEALSRRHVHSRGFEGQRRLIRRHSDQVTHRRAPSPGKSRPPRASLIRSSFFWRTLIASQSWTCGSDASRLKWAEGRGPSSYRFSDTSIPLRSIENISPICLPRSSRITPREFLSFATLLPPATATLASAALYVPSMSAALVRL